MVIQAKNRKRCLPRTVWTERRLEWLIQGRANKLTAKEIADELGVTPHAVRCAICYYNLPKVKRRGTS